MRSRLDRSAVRARRGRRRGRAAPRRARRLRRTPGVVRGVDGPLARRAVPPAVRARAAGAVARHAGVIAAGAPGRPPRQHPQGVGQLRTGRREAVGVADGPGRVRLADHEAVRLEAGQPPGEDVRAPGRRARRAARRSGGARGAAGRRRAATSGRPSPRRRARGRRRQGSGRDGRGDRPAPGGAGWARPGRHASTVPSSRSSLAICKSLPIQRHRGRKTEEPRMSESTSTGGERTVAQQVADAVAPAVVRIGRGGGRGCGIVVGDGLVATNAHNLRDRTTEVTFADGRATQGRATAVDPDGDLTVLAVDTAGISPPAWADAAPAEGAAVYAVAAIPGGRRVTQGTVSAVDRSFRGPARPPGHRGHRAHRPAGQGHVGQPGRRRRRTHRRPHHPATRRRPRARPARRRGPAPSRRRPRRRPGAAPPRARRRHRPRPAPPGGCAGRSACPTVRAPSCGASPTTARPPSPAWRPAT